MLSEFQKNTLSVGFHVIHALQRFVMTKSCKKPLEQSFSHLNRKGQPQIPFLNTLPSYSQRWSKLL